MNKDRVIGTIDEAAGLAKRKTGELTGNTQLEVEGMLQQVKGKVENVWGKAKDVVRDANEEAAVDHKTRIQEAIDGSVAADNTAKRQS
jgi:uncharacterized protein YjbJ (UPF0337 family)